MKAASACALCLMACSAAMAQGAADTPSTPGFQLWANPGFFTYHFNRDAGLRGLNYGAGAEANFQGNLSLLGGSFINSNYLRSRYAALAWQPLARGSVSMGAAIGAVNGYPGVNNGGWFPVMLPWLSIRGEHVGLNLSYAPNYRGVHRAVIAQLIVRIW